MNCSQGRRLLERLRQDAALDDLERRLLSEHLSTCRDCRREAVELDPVHLFLGAASLDPEPSEIEAVRHTVKSMLRLRELDATRSRSRRRAGWTVAAGILLAAVFLSPTGERGRPAPEAEPASEAPLSIAQRLPAQEFARVSDWSGTSVIENLDRPEARIYQLTEQDLLVVMIVDESLDL